MLWAPGLSPSLTLCMSPGVASSSRSEHRALWTGLPFPLWPLKSLMWRQVNAQRTLALSFRPHSPSALKVEWHVVLIARPSSGSSSGLAEVSLAVTPEDTALLCLVPWLGGAHPAGPPGVGAGWRRPQSHWPMWLSGQASGRPSPCPGALLSLLLGPLLFSLLFCVPRKPRISTGELALAAGLPGGASSLTCRGQRGDGEPRAPRGRGVNWKISVGESRAED